MKNGELLDKIKNQFELLEKLPLGVKFYEEYHKYNEYAQEINKIFKIEKEDDNKSGDDSTIFNSFFGYITFKVIPIICLLEENTSVLFEKLPKGSEKIFNDLKFHFGKLSKKEGDRDFEYWFTHTDKLFNDFLDNIKTTQKGNDLFIETNIMNVMHELLDLLEKQKINKELKTSTIKTIDKNDIHKLVLMYKDYLKKNGEEKTEKEFSFSLRDKNELNILTIYQEENKTKEELMSPIYIFQKYIKDIEVSAKNNEEEKKEYRVSNFFTHIKNTDILLKNRELFDNCMSIVEKYLSRGHIIGVEILETEDDVLQLLKDLELIEIDWEGRNRQTHRQIGNRYIPIKIYSNKILELKDRIEGKVGPIRKETLELISRDIGDRFTLTKIKENFIDVGVPEKMFLETETKWRAVFYILSYYSSSKKDEEKNLFSKILSKTLHPIFFDGDIEKSTEKTKKYNEYLAYDKLSFNIDFKNDVEEVKELKNKQEIIKEFNSYDVKNLESNKKIYLLKILFSYYEQILISYRGNGMFFATSGIDDLNDYFKILRKKIIEIVESDTTFSNLKDDDSFGIIQEISSLYYSIDYMESWEDYTYKILLNIREYIADKDLLENNCEIHKYDVSLVNFLDKISTEIDALKKTLKVKNNNFNKNILNKKEEIISNLSKNETIKRYKDPEIERFLSVLSQNTIEGVTNYLSDGKILIDDNNKLEKYKWILKNDPFIFENESIGKQFEKFNIIFKELQLFMLEKFHDYNQNPFYYLYPDQRHSTKAEDDKFWMENFLELIDINDRFEKEYLELIKQFNTHGTNNGNDTIKIVHKFENSIQEKDIDLNIKNINENKKQDNNKKYPYKLNAGTTWQNINMTFVDNENIFINIKNQNHKTNYIEMGFNDKRNGNPNKQWELLKVLAKNSGNIGPKNQDAKDNYEKQKELLSNKLKKYFGIEYDPFEPYKKGEGYKTKFTLMFDNKYQNENKDTENSLEKESQEIFDDYMK